MNKFISKYKSLLIFNDMAMLEKVFDIKIPKQIDLDKCFDNLLAIKLQNSKDKQQAVNYLNILLSYQENLKPYLQFYFTILELGLTDTFTIWIKKFKQSDIYLFHNKNVVQNERCIRWSQSLMASIIL
jgi:hypothetical protein